MPTVSVADLEIGNDRPLTIIAGPCQLESADHAQMIAGTMKEICDKAGAQYIFKSSFDKANRTSVQSSRGLGMDEGLKVLNDVGKAIGVPVITDVHKESQCAPAADAVDVLQIPAYLCRQTDLLIAAGQTGAAINVKKGQFLAPWDMENVAAKIASTGNESILLTERGTTFGYNTLVTDMRALPQMATTGYPVVMDATHSVQQPGGLGGASGGQRDLAPVMARAAAAIGVAGIFMETHQDPDTAPCDGPNMIYLSDMGHLIDILMRFDEVAKANLIKV